MIFKYLELKQKEKKHSSEAMTEKHLVGRIERKVFAFIWLLFCRRITSKLESFYMLNLHGSDLKTIKYAREGFKFLTNQTKKKPKDSSFKGNQNEI